MYVFTMPANKWDEQNPNRQAVLQLVQKHASQTPHLLKLKQYYEGKHDILDDSDRKIKLVCNHAKDIADTATAYFIGEPVSYKSSDDIQPLTEALNTANADETDGDNGIDLSIYGRAYEYIYTKENDTVLQTKNLEPESTFMVYDDSIEQNELFAVYYYVRKDDSDTSGIEHYIATVLTKNYRWVYDLCEIESESSVLEGPTEHFKGEVPVIEYQNNKLAIGDYELQIPLIDAYNTLASDRVIDKEQFIDALLVIYGTLLTDPNMNDDENGSGSSEAMERLRKLKLLEMPDGSKAEYLTRTFDENGVEILKKALEQDIHKFSHIPCMSDESFGGNVSGVAMEYKLLGMENITKIKTRYYRKGLRKRIRIFCNWLATNARASIDPSGITAIFTRAMPKNLLEISQYVANLKGTVSQKTLLSQIPFVPDPDEELELVNQEALESVKRQQEMFGMTRNEPPEDKVEEREEPGISPAQKEELDEE